MSSTLLALVQPVEESPPEEKSSSDWLRTHTCQMCTDTRLASAEVKENSKENTVPTRQIGDYFEAEIQRRAEVIQQRHPFAHVFVSQGTTIRAEVTRQAKINERRLYAWRTGELATMTLPKADEILTNAGIAWWQVWNEGTVRIPIIRVQRRSQVVKKNKDGTPRDFTAKGYIDYGDKGVDELTLRRIRRLWEPPMDVAARLWGEGWEEAKITADQVQYDDYVIDRKVQLGFVRGTRLRGGRIEIFYDHGSKIHRLHKRFTVLRNGVLG